MITKGFFGSSSSQSPPWEKWTIQLRIVKKKENRKVIAKLAESVKKRMMYISKTAHEKTDHLPGISNEKLSMDGCYPFSVFNLFFSN